MAIWKGTRAVSIARSTSGKKQMGFVMPDPTAKFVAEWISLNIRNNLPSGNRAEIIARLARRLEHAAWESGISRDDFLMAVGGDSYEHVLSEIERRLLAASTPSLSSLTLVGPA